MQCVDLLLPPQPRGGPQSRQQPRKKSNLPPSAPKPHEPVLFVVVFSLLFSLNPIKQFTGHDTESINLDSSSDDDDEFVVPMSDKFKSMINSGAVPGRDSAQGQAGASASASSTSAPPTAGTRKNPYDSLRDIARQEHSYENETDNLALYQVCALRAHG